MKRPATITAVILFVALSAGCSDSGGSGGAPTLTVFAASSLTDVFEDIGAAFERRSDGAELEFVFGASSDLVTQLEQGARADVFASADEANMSRALDAGLVERDPRVFARNELEIIVPPDNPGGVTELADLANQDLVLTICSPECPAGRYALEIFDTAGVAAVPDSFEAEVKGVVSRVALGEADAGIAFVTDRRAAGGAVEGIPIADDVGVVASYPIAALGGASAAADRWIEFVLAGAGQKILRRHGFLPK